MNARKILEATVFGSVLTLGIPMAVGAQANQQEPGSQTQQQQPSHSQMGSQHSGQQAQQQQQGKRESVRGTVSKIDANKGELSLRSEEGEELELRGKPTELQRVQEGDQVRARYQEFGSEKWLTGRPQKVQGQQSSQQQGQSPSQQQRSQPPSAQPPSGSQPQGGGAQTY